MQDVKYIGNNQLLIHATNGFHYVFPADDMSVGLHLLLQGNHEPWLEPVFKKLLKSGHKVIVVGSNIGYHDVMISRLIGAEGKLISFEPNPALVPLLQKNLTLNICTSFEVVQKAVSNGPGSSQLYLLEHDYGGSSLQMISANGTKRYTTVDVPVTSLDYSIFDGPYRLLKVDAEGSESQVLSGAMGLIEKGQIENIIIEHNPDYYTEMLDFNVTALRKLGFRCWLLTESCRWPEYIGPVQRLDPCDLLFSKEIFK